MTSSWSLFIQLSNDVRSNKHKYHYVFIDQLRYKSFLAGGLGVEDQQHCLCEVPILLCVIYFCSDGPKRKCDDLKNGDLGKKLRTSVAVIIGLSRKCGGSSTLVGEVCAKFWGPRVVAIMYSI